MNIKLTEAQQDRLKAVSSNIRGDARDNMSEELVESVTNQINEVLYELHLESPEAFSTFAYRNQKGKVMFSQLKNY